MQMNLEVIKQYASALARRRGHYDTDDIVAEAFLAYAQATAKLQTLQVTNPDAYIQSWVTGACKHAMAKKQPPTLPLTEDAATYVLDNTKELVEALKLTPIEYQVLNYRLQGYTDEEIGAKLSPNMTKQGVHKARSRIMSKFGNLTAS
jgi:DNA-directed RNA polymerase specialized sigma24 family protein